MKQMIIDNIDFHELESMKYWSFPSTWDIEKKKRTVNERIFSGEWYGALKRDGAFYKFIKSDTGEMELIGRSKSKSGDYLNKIDWVPHLQTFFDNLPNGTCLLGELYLPSKEEAKATSSIMNCLQPKAVKRQEKEKLIYYIFDILAYNGESLVNEPAIHRFDLLKNMFHNVSNYSFCYDDYKYIQFAFYYSGQELWNKLQDYLADGLEGIVITKATAPYRPGKRPSKETLKIKKELQETIDCIIIGANPPSKTYEGKEIEDWTYWYNEQTNQKINKKLYQDYVNGAAITPVTKNWYNGWAGSLKLGVYKDDKLIQIGNLSGINDEMKQNWKQYVGKVVEISAMEVMNTGGIRHPRLVGIKEDKNPKDCNLEQIC